jgi:hypothetical protein
MKVDARLLLLGAKLTIWTMWPLTAWAASITFGERMAAIPLLAILMTAMLSTLSGVTALLHKMKQEYEKSGEIQRLWLFISSNLLGSNVAGLLCFFAAESYNVTDTMEAAAIVLAAFGGTWLIERALLVVANRYIPEPKP